MRICRCHKLVAVAGLVVILPVLLMYLEFFPFSHHFTKPITPESISDSHPCSGALDINYKCWIPEALYLPNGDFDKAIKNVVDTKNTVYLISVDSGYVDMALNLHESSFKRLNIANYLYVCSDQNAQDTLQRYGINCFLYQQKKISVDAASGYMDGDFAKKTHIKTKIVLSALLLGYSVILSDVDIVYTREPASFLFCKTCDMEIQSDHMEANSGFYIAHPKSGSILLHKMTLASSMMPGEHRSQQMIFNDILRQLENRHLINYTLLNPQLFPCGYYYYEVGKRMYAGNNPCTTCVIIHNNWIVSKAAKIYRFKENLQWHVDTDQYYSDPQRKYLIYENGFDFLNDNIGREMAALVNALFIGYLLKRTVILPTFVCGTCSYQSCENPSKRCALNTYLHIAVFDKYLGKNYRENVFLSHSKVPASVRASISPALLIKTSLVKLPADSTLKHSNEKIFIPADSQKGVQPSEILNWFEKNEDLKRYAVLKFNSLYDIFHQSPEKYSVIYAEFAKKIERAFVYSDYRQYDTRSPFHIRFWTYITSFLKYTKGT